MNETAERTIDTNIIYPAFNRLDWRHVDCTETAKLIRVQLKRHFPGVTFSVKSSRYSGGSSVHINWTDGPRSADVDAVTRQFNGHDFDGMTDSSINLRHWLLTNGTTALYSRDSRSGTDRYQGSNTPPEHDAELVSFSPSVSCQRSLSPDRMIEAAALLAHLSREMCYAPHDLYDVYYNGQVFTGYGTEVVRQLAYTL